MGLSHLPPSRCQDQILTAPACPRSLKDARCRVIARSPWPRDTKTTTVHNGCLCSALSRPQRNWSSQHLKYSLGASETLDPSHPARFQIEIPDDDSVVREDLLCSNSSHRSRILLPSKLWCHRPVHIGSTLRATAPALRWGGGDYSPADEELHRQQWN